MAKLVIVVGSTGAQGGSVIKELLSNPIYKIRGITRNTTSEKALALAAKGIAMVSADLNDEESLVKAFQGANIIFAFTNFFEAFATQGPDPAMEIEYTQGVNMAKAASKTSTLEHYIWSTLPDSKAMSGGTIEIPHFQSKWAVDEYIKKDAELVKKTTFLFCTFFMDTMTYPILIPNFLKSAEKFVQLLPVGVDTPILCLGDHVYNIGIFVEAILSKPHLALPGKYVLATTETKTVGEMLEKWSQVTGKQASYLQITLEAYEALRPMWGREVGLNLKLWEKFGDKSWSTEALIGKEELGIGKGLIGVEQALEEINWSVFL